MIHWNANPEVLNVGFLQVRWYGLLFLLGFISGYRIMKWVFLREGKSIEALPDLLSSMILGTVIGARLGHCFFYEPGYFLSNPIEIFKVWNGGLASHGGALGVLFVMWRHGRKHPETPFPWILDRMMMPIAITAAFIRLGNLMNSEIIGRPSDVPWAFVFERVDALPRHPAQLYESISYFLSFALLFFVYSRTKRLPQGFLLGLGFVTLFGARFVCEFFKEDQAAFEQEMLLNMGQVLSLPFWFFGLWMLFRGWKEMRRPLTG